MAIVAAGVTGVLPGDPVDDRKVRVVTATGTEDSSLNVVRGTGFAVLGVGLDADGSAALVAAAAELGAALSPESVRAVLVGGAVEAAPAEATVLDAPDLLEALGATAGEAFVIRPDGLLLCRVPVAELSGVAAALRSGTAPDGPAALTFTLTVDDGRGRTDTDTVTITVNGAPTADAGDDATAVELTTVTLDGTDSTDPDDDTLTYAWAQTGGPAVELSDATAAQPTFTMPLAPATVTFTRSSPSSRRAPRRQTLRPRSPRCCSPIPGPGDSVSPPRSISCAAASPAARSGPRWARSTATPRSPTARPICS